MKKIPLMTSFSRGDVVLVRYPFSEKVQMKKRPALVISVDAYHKGRQEVLLAAITSNVERILPGDTNIQEWKEAGLLFPSLVAGIIQTFKSDMIEKKVGILSKQDFNKAEVNLRKAMGF